MALIAHWPLNGNTNDISGFGKHGSANGTLTSSTAGKIGLTYIFENNENGVDISNNNFSGLTSYTMSAWINPAGNHRNYNGTILSSGNWNGTCWAFGVNQTNTAIDVAGRGYNKYIDYTFTLNTWTHILSVVSNGVSKVYVNGNYLGQITVTSTLASDATNTFIGRETYAGGHFSFNGKINDVRIYDHALTDMEIQEIARAKILHYTFDNMQEPTTNLIINPLFDSTNNWSLSTNGGGSFSVVDSYGKITKGTNGSYNYIAQNLTKSNTNKTLTLSAKFKNNVIGNCALRLVVFDGGDVPTQPMSTISLDGSGGTIIGSVTASYSGTATAYRLDILSGSYYSGLSDIDIEVTEVQLEEKPYVTEFVNGTRTTRVSDYSGFFNHSDPLTETTTPRWTADSKIGTGAYYFNGSGSPMNIIDINRSFGAAQTEYTIVFWAKNEDPARGNMPIASLSNTNFYWYGDSSWRYVHGTSGEFYYPKSVSIPVGSWGHFCVTYDGANVKIYRNGVYEGQQSSTGIANLSNGFRIGNWTNSSTYQYHGYIDDVRIYATALSEKDIKDLYETRAEIEQSGVLYARDFLSNVEETVNLFSAIPYNVAPSYTLSSYYGWYLTGIANDNPRVRIYNQALPILPSTFYTFSAIYWSSNNEIDDVYLEFTGTGYPEGNRYLQPFRSDHTAQLSGSTTIVDLGNGWKRCSGTFQTTANTAGIKSMFIDSDVPGVNVFIANIQLEQKNYATPFTSTYRPAIQLPSTIEFGANEVHETGTANFEDFSTVGVTDGLVAYLPLDRNSLNYSGNSLNFTAYNTPSVINESHYFNGTTQYLGIPNNTLLTPGTSDFTIVVSFLSPTLRNGEVFGKRTDGAGNIEMQIGSGGQIYTYLANLSGTTHSNTSTYTAGVWQHYVLSRQGTSFKIYVNNVLTGDGTMAVDFDISPVSAFEIARDPGNAAEYFQGYVKQFKYFNRTLTAEEISIEYNTMFKNEVQIHESGVLYAKDLKQY